MSEEIKKKQEEILSKINPIYDDFCKNREDIIEEIKLNPYMGANTMRLSKLRDDYVTMCGNLLDSEIKSGTLGAEIDGDMVYVDAWAGFMENIDKDIELMNNMIKGFNKSQDVDLLIDRLNNNINDIIADSNSDIVRDDLKKVLESLLDFKISYMESLSENDIINNDNLLSVIIKHIKQYRYDITSNKTYKEQNNGKNKSNPENDKVKLQELLSRIIVFLENNKNSISNGNKDCLDDIEGCIKEFTNIKNKHNNDEINNEQCLNSINMNNGQFKNFFDIDLLESIKENANKKSNHTNPVKEKISLSNIDNYDSLLVEVNNYIKLVDNKQIDALRSEDAVRNGRDSEESRKRYFDIKMELSKIAKSASDKKEPLEVLIPKLESIANELKDKYDLDISMKDKTVRHKVVKVRKGNIRRALGVFASNALFLQGLMRVPYTIDSYRAFGFDLLGIKYTAVTVAFLIIPIIIDLLKQTRNQKENLFIVTILKRFVDKANYIKNNMNNEGGRTR